MSEKAGEDLVAFANQNGGIIYFGVENGGKIKGIQGVSDKTLRELTQLYGDNTEPRLYPAIEAGICEGKNIIRLEIKKSSTPYHTFRRIPYVRVGSSNKQMSVEEYKKRLIEYGNTNFDLSAEICKRLTFEDLDSLALETLRKKWAEKEQREEYLKLSLQTVLEKLLLVRDNEITFAALLLCGKSQKIFEFLPEAEIRFGWKSSPQKLDFDFTKDWREPFLKIDDDIWATINARNSRFPFVQGFFEGDIWAFDQKSIREAVLNAFAHRDYREKGSIFLEASPMSFIAKSPGRFLPGVSPENALDVEGKWRNRLMMETLGKIGLVERYGHGLDRIFTKTISEGKGTPLLVELKTGFVLLEIPAQVKDEKFIIFLQKISKEKQISFDVVKDLIFLDEIREKQISPDKEKRDRFMSMGIIEKVGKGRGTRYLLGHKFYEFLGKTGEHTRKQWHSKDSQKELLRGFFKKNKKGRMTDIRDDLFEKRLNNKQVNVLLSELRNEGEIYFEGPQRSQKAFWKVKT